MTLSVSRRFTSSRLATLSNPLVGISPRPVVPSDGVISPIAPSSWSWVTDPPSVAIIADAWTTAARTSAPEKPALRLASWS